MGKRLARSWSDISQKAARPRRIQKIDGYFARKAIEHAKRLPKEQQEVIAAIIEAELADEAKWQARFNETLSTLGKLQESAHEQYRSGDYDKMSISFRG